MLKLGDFGLSKNLGGQMFTQTYVGVRIGQDASAQQTVAEILICTSNRRRSICPQKSCKRIDMTPNQTYGAWDA